MTNISNSLLLNNSQHPVFQSKLSSSSLKLHAENLLNPLSTSLKELRRSRIKKGNTPLNILPSTTKSSYELDPKLEFLQPHFQNYVENSRDSHITVEVLNKITTIVCAHFSKDTGSFISLDDREFIVLHNRLGSVEDVLHKIQTLGRGGFGEVASYISVTTFEEKVIKLSSLDKADQLQNELNILDELHADEEGMEDLESVVGIQDKPYRVVRIHDGSGRPFSKGLIGKKYDGDGNLLIANDPQTTAYLLHTISQIFLGLHHLQTRQIFHGDIKVTNLLVRKQTSNEFCVHLADFGGACFVRNASAIFDISKHLYTENYTAENDLEVIETLMSEFEDILRSENDDIQREAFLNKLQHFTHATDVYSCCYTIGTLFVKNFSNEDFSMSNERDILHFAATLKQRGLSDQLIDNLKRGLDLDYLKRPTAMEFLNAPDFSLLLQQSIV